MENIKQIAKKFAIKAHANQVRKNEPDKPYQFHPLSVGAKLEEYGCDDITVMAGYLHDVVEDTDYKIEDIQNKFGLEVANIVNDVSENKTLSWEERKKETIDKIRKMPLNSKLVICADKIDNLEDLMIKFQKTGTRDFSKFKRGEEKQKWYYSEIYKSLTADNQNHPMFDELKTLLDNVFNYKEDEYLNNVIFDDNKEYYQNLKRLHAQKLELKKLKKICTLLKPFVVEFSGTPRTGKTTTINNLYDFFKKGGFNVSIIEEFTTSKYYKEHLKKELDKLSLEDNNLAIADLVYKQLLENLNNNEIILIDRSINDRQIWNYRRYVKGDISEENYLNSRKKYSQLSKELIDVLVVTYADAIVSLKRDYNSSLALEERRFLNKNNIDEYNDSLTKLKDLFSKSVADFVLVDTSSMDMSLVSVEVAERLMNDMRKKYIKSFKNGL